MIKLSYLAFAILGVLGTIHGIALPFFIEKFNLTLTNASLLLSISSLGFLVGSLGFPWLDRLLSKKYVLGFGFFILSLAHPFLPIVTPWTVVVILGFIASLGVGTIEVGFNTLISSLKRSDSTKIMNLAHFFYGVGALLGPLFLSRFLNFGLSWHSFYLVPSVFTCGFLFLWVKNKDISNSFQKTQAELPKENSIYRELYFWFLLSSIFIYVACEVGLVGWIPTLLTEIGIQAETTSLGVSVLWIGITLGRGLCAKFSHLLKTRTLLLILTTGSAFILLLLALPLSPLLLFLLLFLLGLFFSSIFPLILLFAAQLYPQTQAVVTSGLVTAGSLGALFGPTFLGFIGQVRSLQFGLPLLATFMLGSTFLIMQTSAQRKVSTR